MKCWLTVPLVGAGTVIDPIRPNLEVAYVVGATAGGRCLALVAATPEALAALSTRPDIAVLADEPLTADGALAVMGEAIRLGTSVDWRPGQYDVVEA